MNLHLHLDMHGRMKNRAHSTGKFVAVVAAALLVSPVALAQDATPTAGGEGDAMVRAMDPSALNTGMRCAVPSQLGQITVWLIRTS